MKATTTEALERIIEHLHPHFLTHVDLYGITRFPEVDVLSRNRKELQPYWRKLKISKIQWQENGMLLSLEQENYCGSTCVNDDDDPSDPDYGRCAYGGRSYAEITITFEQLKPFLKTEKAFLIDMIDEVPETVAKLCGKTIEQVEQWKYIEWEKLYGEGIRNMYKR